MATKILVLLLAGDGILAGILSSVVTWLLTRKKYNSEVENGNIQNMQEALEFYKTFRSASALLLEDTRVAVDKLRTLLREIDLELKIQKT